MFLRIKAYGVTRFVNSSKTSEIDNFKAASDFEVELDKNGEVKLYSGIEVKNILNPSANVKVNLAETLGVKPKRKSK